MDAGIYFPLYVVLKCEKKYSVFYLSSDLQTEEMFIKRKPLSSSAKRAGWQGYLFDGEIMKDLVTRLIWLKKQVQPIQLSHGGIKLNGELSSSLELFYLF